MTKEEMFNQADAEEEIVLDNIEDSGVIEKSEWRGTKQKAVRQDAVKIEELKPVEVEVESATETVEQYINDLLGNIDISEIFGISEDSMAEAIAKYNPVFNDIRKKYKVVEKELNDISKDPTKPLDDFAKEVVAEYNKSIEFIKKSYGSEIKKSINTIKSSASEIKTNTEILGQTISSAISSAMIPSTLVIGTAAGVPNPIREALNIMQLLSTTTTQVNALKSSCIKILNVFVDIKMPLPDALASIIVSVTALVNMISGKSEENSKSCSEDKVSQAKKDAADQQKKADEIKAEEDKKNETITLTKTEVLQPILDQSNIIRDKLSL